MGATVPDALELWRWVEDAICGNDHHIIILIIIRIPTVGISCCVTLFSTYVHVNAYSGHNKNHHSLPPCLPTLDLVRGRTVDEDRVATVRDPRLQTVSGVRSVIE